jgi:hypothetical protein
MTNKENTRDGSSLTFAENLIRFFKDLHSPKGLPKDVELLWPFSDDSVFSLMKKFFRRYYADRKKRIFLLGINPGRFGAGVTGICFTDPIHLSGDCGIGHSLPLKPELSSTFIYAMIKKMGGPEAFYRRFYLGAVSPVGFVREGRNMNYYDRVDLKEVMEPYILNTLKQQIEAGADTSEAVSLGRGTNFRYLEDLNNKYKLFDRITALPHPRWIMQYRRRELEEYLDLYCRRLSLFTEKSHNSEKNL